MSIIDYVKGKLQEVFSPPEPPDPQEQFDKLLSRLHGELRTAKITAADMIRDEKRVAAERDDYRISAQRDEDAAANALHNGQDSAARRFIERKLHASTTADQLESERAALDARIGALRDAVETYKLEIERVEREQRTWEMRQRTARIRSEARDDVSSTALSEARSLLRSSEERARREEARAEVRDRIGRATPQTQLREKRAQTEVEREMDRIRQSLKAPTDD